METSTFEQRIEKLRNSKTIISSGQEYVGLYELNNRSAEKFIRANLRGNYVKMTRATLSESREKVQRKLLVMMQKAWLI